MASQSGCRVAFTTAVDCVVRVKTSHVEGRLPVELARRRLIGLIIFDEVGYIPFE